MLKVLLQAAPYENHWFQHFPGVAKRTLGILLELRDFEMQVSRLCHILNELSLSLYQQYFHRIFSSLDLYKAFSHFSLGVGDWKFPFRELWLVAFSLVIIFFPIQAPLFPLLSAANIFPILN